MIEIPRAAIGSAPARVPANNAGVIESQLNARALEDFAGSIERVITRHNQRRNERLNQEANVEAAALMSEMRGRLETFQDGLKRASLEDLEEISRTGGNQVLQDLEGIARNATNDRARRIVNLGLAGMRPQFLAGFLGDVEDRIFGMKQATIGTVSARGSVQYGPQWDARLQDARFDDMDLERQEYAQTVNLSPYHTPAEKNRLTESFNRDYLTSAARRLRVEDPDRFVDVVRGGALNGRVSANDLVSFLGNANQIQRDSFRRHLDGVRLMQQLPEGQVATPEALEARIGAIQNMAETLEEEFRGDAAIPDQDLNGALVDLGNVMARVEEQKISLDLGSRLVNGQPVPFDPADPRLRRGVDLYIRTNTMATLLDPQMSPLEKTNAVKSAVRANGGQHPSIASWMEQSMLSGDPGRALLVAQIDDALQQELKDVYEAGRGTSWASNPRGYAVAQEGARSSGGSTGPWTEMLDAFKARTKAGLSPADALSQSRDGVANRDLRGDVRDMLADKRGEENPHVAAFRNRITDNWFGSTFLSGPDPRPTNQTGPFRSFFGALLPNQEPRTVPADLLSSYRQNLEDALVQNGGQLNEDVTNRAFNRTLRNEGWAVDFLDPQNPVWKRSPILAAHGQLGFDQFAKELGSSAVVQNQEGQFVSPNAVIGETRLEAFMFEDPAAPGGMKYEIYEKLRNGERRQILFKVEGQERPSPFWVFDRESAVQDQIQSRAQAREETPALRAALSQFDSGSLHGSVLQMEAEAALQEQDPERLRAVTRKVRQSPTRFVTKPKFEIYGGLQNLKTRAEGTSKDLDETISRAVELQGRLERDFQFFQRRVAYMTTARAAGANVDAERKAWAKYQKFIRGDWETNIQRIGEAVLRLQDTEHRSRAERQRAIRSVEASFKFMDRTYLRDADELLRDIRFRKFKAE